MLIEKQKNKYFESNYLKLRKQDWFGVNIKKVQWKEKEKKSKLKYKFSKRYQCLSFWIIQQKTYICS